MPTTANLSSLGQGQIGVSYTFENEIVNEAWSMTITNVRLLPRIGQAQVLEILMTAVSPVHNVSFNVPVRVTYYDEAFEEFNLYGAPRNKEAPGEPV